MRSTAERRQMILQTLCERRSEHAENLALEFDVSIRTIYYDIEFLAYSYPIYTTKGTGGGIHVKLSILKIILTMITPDIL